MPATSISPQDDRPEFLPGTSASFQISGEPSQALAPGVSLCGTLRLAGTGGGLDIFLPSTGVRALIRSLYVSSAKHSGLLNLVAFPRLAAVRNAAEFPSNKLSTSGDLSSPSLGVSKGVTQKAVGAATGKGMPFAIPLATLAGGLFSRPLPFASTGTIQVLVGLNSAADGMVQTGGSTDATFIIEGLSLAFDVGELPPDPASPPKIPLYIRPEVQAVNLESGRFSLSIPQTETLMAAAVVFSRTGSANNIGVSNAVLETPPGLSRVKISLQSSPLSRFDVDITDPYGARALCDFSDALGVLFGISPTAPALVSRGSSMALPWRMVNTTAGGGSEPIANAGRSVEDGFGLGAIFPPAGKAGELSVTIEWAPSASPLSAHLILGFVSDS